MQAGVEPLQQPDMQGAADQPDAIASMRRNIRAESSDLSLQSLTPLSETPADSSGIDPRVLRVFSAPALMADQL